MKKKIRIAIMVLVFGLFVSQGALTAYAETESSDEGGSMVVTQAGNASSDTTLSSLKIAQAALHPEFDSNQLTYTATVPYEVDRVALTAKTNSPDAKKVIRGTSDLEVGENTITVTVTAQNGSTREYRITLIRQEMVETTTAEGGESQSQEETSTSEDPQTSEAPQTEDQTTEETSADETESVSDEGEGSLETNDETSEAETTAPETIVIPSNTESNGGMIVETSGETSRDLADMLANPMVLLVVLAAIVVVSLFAVVALIIVRKESGEDDEDEDDEEEDGTEDSVETETQAEGTVVTGSSAGEALAAEPSAEERILAGSSSTKVIAEKKSADQGLTAQDPAEAEEWDFEMIESEEDSQEDDSQDDDLDDDFEMLLEDDDDFDFLDF